MIIVWILLALLGIYLVLTFPRLRRPIGRLKEFDYAHRGLWDESAPENSLPAFRRAVENGFGIELDVHLTRDNHLVVFHDDTLDRMCGVPGKVCDMTLKELRRLRLSGTECTIPTLAEVLKVVNGRVPLIVEIKPDKRLNELCRHAYAVLQRYNHPGMWCMESFHPLAVHWFRKNAPEVIRGQLAYGMKRRDKKMALDSFIASLVFNALSRPDFIAFKAVSDRSLPMLWMRICRPWFVAWTVRSQAEMDEFRKRYHMQIFEGFIPKR